MRILVDNIQSNKKNLEKEMENFQNNHLNLFNEFSEIMDYWQDPFSISFKNTLAEAKQKEMQFISNINELIAVYDYLIEKLQDYKKVEYIKENRELLIQKFDNYITKLEKIITSYNNLNINLLDSKFFLIQKEKRSFSDTLKKINNLKNLTKEKINYLEEIEENIKLKTNKINIKKLEEINTENYL